MSKTERFYEIIHQDNSIVVVNKAANVLSVPDRYNRDITNLKDLLYDKFGEIFVAHRLDKETSGIMVFAKNSEAHRNLNTQFQNQEVKKLYDVLVKGRFENDELEIDIPIMPNPGKKGLAIPSARGKKSLTIVKVLEKFTNSTLLECNIITGRHHQIRVHLSTVGHPLYIDKDYGGEDAFYVSSVKRNFNLKKNTEEKPILERLSMHARELTFSHPDTNKKVTFKAEAPKDFTATLQILRKYKSIK